MNRPVGSNILRNQRLILEKRKNLETPSLEECLQEVISFPNGTAIPKAEQESTSFRNLSSIDWTGVWVDDARYFHKTKGRLHCRQVWWLDVRNCITEVPPGRWEVLVPLKYNRSPPNHKMMDWTVSIISKEGHGGIEKNTSLAHAVGPDVGEFDSGFYGQWKTYRLGIANVPVLPAGCSSTVQLRVFGPHGQRLTDFFFGPLILRAVSIPWEKERLLHLTLKPVSYTHLTLPTKA